jgi:hypothetical protein
MTTVTRRSTTYVIVAESGPLDERDPRVAYIRQLNVHADPLDIAKWDKRDHAANSK